MSGLITEPGVYDHIPELAYHHDTLLAPHLGHSLSASGAKTLLASPARFAYEREHGRPGTAAMDFGTLVHALVLRSHDERIVVSPHETQRTNAAKEFTAQAEAEGRIVVSAKDVRRAIAVAKAVRAHPLAGAILTDGRPEVSLYWLSEEGVTCRARIDWLHPKAIVDLKTVSRYGGSELDTFGRQAASLDYPLSAAHYREGWHALTGEWLDFLTITVETEAPHFVQVTRYSEADLAAGSERMRRARQEFAERESSGVWVDPPEIHTLPVPAWYARSAS